MQSVSQKIDMVAPKLQAMVASFEAGTFKEGAEAFNAQLMAMLYDANLVSTETRSIDAVGVHPDNREGAMLVPCDVHDLLLQLATKGFNPSVWQALACTIPEGDIGEKWRQANVDLVAGSEGKLAPVSKDGLQLLTGRGSHGTAALRAAKFGAVSVHPELASASGEVSRMMLLEKQPSLAKPLETGCEYEIIPGELVVKVPGLFAAISRIGNASNDSFRLQTTLQHCNRIHQLACSMGSEPDWDRVAAVAAIGMDKPTAEKLCKFVQAWSGGKDAGVLKDLEAYERTLSVRRKIMAEDMIALSKLDLAHAPTYVPAACMLLCACFNV